MYFILALPAIIGLGFMLTAILAPDVFLGPHRMKRVSPVPNLREDLQHCQDDVEMFYHSINGHTP